MRWAWPHLGRVALRDAEIDLDGIDGLQVNQILALLDIIAGTDPPQTEDAAERRAQHGLVQACPGQGESGARLLEGRVHLVVFLLAHHPLGEQIAGAFEFQFPERQAGFTLIDLGPVFGGIEMTKTWSLSTGWPS